MKSILAIILGLFCFYTQGMEPAHIPTITYSSPIMIYNSSSFEIRALKGGTEIGSIVYDALPGKKAKIILFEVDEAERKNSDTRVGMHLFQKAINALEKAGYEEISWDVTPTDDVSMQLVLKKDRGTLMNLFLKIIISTLLFASFYSVPAISMEAPLKSDIAATEQVTYAAPAQTEIAGHRYMIIEAFLNKNKIGHIIYKPISYRTNAWEIKELAVVPEHRHTNKEGHTNKRVGSGLFKRCILDISFKRPSKIEWTVTPLEGSTLEVKELVGIYEKMVKRVQPLLQYKTTLHRKDYPFGYASEMELVFHYD